MMGIHREIGKLGIVAAIALALAIPAVAVAGPPVASPTEVLKDLNEQVAKIIKKKQPKAKQDDQLKKVVDKMLNFKMLTKAAFGKYWKDMDAAQQEKAIGLLTDLIQRNYIKQIDDRKDEKYIVKYEGEEVEDDKATVTTLVVSEERHDEETEIVYKMVKAGAKWKVKDIETDGVSLTRNYRTQFYKIIEKESDPKVGIDKLLEKLQKKVESGDEGAL